MNGTTASPAGDGLWFTLIAMVFWGAAAIPLQGGMRHLHPCTTGALAFGTAALVLALLRIAGLPAGEIALVAPAWKGAAWCILGGCITATALYLQLRAFDLRGISRTVPILNLNTFVAVLGGILVFGEKLTVRGWIGVVLAAAGGYLVQTSGK